ncbi:MAG: ribbon-helix-helix protein, CopG family [Pirellulales bacterium]
MQIDLPQDLVERVQKRAAAGNCATEAEVIRRALDSLDWQDQERKAIQEGIDAWRAGDAQDLDVFDAEFRARNGLQG